MLLTAKPRCGDIGLLQLLAKWRHKRVEWHDRVLGRMHLWRMSDAELRDIGLTRADAWAESQKPFWRV
jgi:uncharacterized protein YjiS (DUF1127 family)